VDTNNIISKNTENVDCRGGVDTNNIISKNTENVDCAMRIQRRFLLFFLCSSLNGKLAFASSKKARNWKIVLTIVMKLRSVGL
jgi:hypothetical protein